MRDGPIRCRRLPDALKVASVLTLGPGLACLVLYTLAEADQQIGHGVAVEAFQQARLDALTQMPDPTLWSANRRAAYDEVRHSDAGAAAALLRIASIDLLVPIFDGTGELALNRGIGRVEGTAPPGADGNVGLAGHRDSFAASRTSGSETCWRFKPWRLPGGTASPRSQSWSQLMCTCSTRPTNRR